MDKIVYPNEYFDIEATLECGQLFRFRPYEKGYLVFSGDKCCYAYADGENIVVETDDGDYFYNYFDLGKDYGEYVRSAEKENTEILTTAARLGKGVRILRQDKEEALFSFIISQNNHIPRIKGIIERLSSALGEKKEFNGVAYGAFPRAAAFAGRDKAFYAEKGLGYRDEYMVGVSRAIVDGYSLSDAEKLSTAELKTNLLTLKGVGPKVADCVSLFGFHRFDSFPVDTWIDRVYRENFGGTESDRNKITAYFVNRFGENSGIFQQYLFYYKRSLEKTRVK